MKNPKPYRFIFSILTILISIISNAQNNETPFCGTVEMDSVLRLQYPELGTKMDFELAIAPYISKFNKAQDSLEKVVVVYTIPVIFHVIHNGENVGSGRNISKALIDAQIEQLNQDFRRTLHGWNGHDDGADIEIEFCPVLEDENNLILTEPGIHRVDRNDLGLTAPPYGVCLPNNSIDKTYIQNNIKPVTQWNPNEYMNIWVMELQCNLLGYAQFPEAPFMDGIDPGNGPANTDGVVLHYESLGSIDTPNPASGINNQGRTATHEIGHWLGLRHIWGDGPCGEDDFCADTPASNAANFNCPTLHISCWSIDMVRNYMDYTSDECKNIFTQDQRARMRIVMGEEGANIPRRGILLNSTKCSNNGCVDNAYEPNNSLNAANTQAFNTVLGSTSVNQTRYGYISSGTDNDYYRINVDQAGELRITMGSLPADYELQLYNSNYQQIDYSVNSGTNGEEVSVDHTQNLSTTFYVRVFGWAGNHSCSDSYLLNLIWTPDNPGGGGGGCTDNAYEPNNSINAANSSAFPIGGSSSVLIQKNAYISSTTDQDYYRITVTQPGELKFNLLSVPADYDLRLYNGSQSQIDYSGNSGTNNEEVTVSHTGTGTAYYYIRVYGYSGAMSCNDSYILRMTWTPDNAGGGGGACNDTAYEPNNSFNNANTSAFPNCGASDFTTARNGYISSSQDVDYYRITVNSPGELKFQLYSIPGDYELLIYNSYHTLLASSTNAGTNSEEVTVNYTGSGTTYYFVKVEGWNGAMDCNDSYLLRLTWDAQTGGGGACVDNAYEPNNSIGAANSNIFPTCGNSNITIARNAYISSTTDEDYYRITVTQAGELKLTMYSLPGDYDLFLYNSNQNQIDYSNGAGTSTEEVIYNYTGSGTTYFYVRVDGYNGAMDCGDSYILRLIWTPSPGGGGGNNGCVDNNYEPNNSIGAANTNAFPTCGGSTVSELRNGYISSTSDNDYYRIKVTGPGELKFTMMGLPYDYDLRLYNQSYNQIDLSNAGGINTEEVSTYHYGTGTYYYYVKIYGYNGAFDCEDSYVMWLRWTPESYVTTLDCGNALQEQVGLEINTTGNTSTGTSYINEYNCGAGGDFSGNEVIYEYHLLAYQHFIAELTNSSHPDLNVFITSDCEGASCLDGGEESGPGTIFADYGNGPNPASFGTYYIIVDGPPGVTATFDLRVFPITVYTFDEDGCPTTLPFVPIEHTCNDDLTYDVEIEFFGSEFYNISFAPYTWTDLGNDRFLVENIPSGESVPVEAGFIDNNCVYNGTLFAFECPCPEIPEPSNPISTNICPGEPYAAIQIDAPESIYQLNWYDAPENGNWVSSQPVFIPNELGTYFAEYTSLLSGCSSTRVPAKLTQSDPIEVFGISQDNVCFGDKEGTIELIPQGGQLPYTFSWQDGDTRQFIDELAAGDYVVTVTDSLGCQFVNTFKIGEPDKMIINHGEETVLCPFDSNAELDISIQGGVMPYNYFWSTGSTQEDIIIDSAGHYIAYVYDANGCLAFDSIFIEESPEIILDSEIAEAACNGDADGQINLTISGGSGGFQFSWNNGGSSEDLTNLSAGDYQVTITDSNACTLVENLNVPQVSDIEVSFALEEIACFGDVGGAIDLNVSGGTGDYTFVWSNGSQDEDISGLEAGDYTVTITDTNDCPAIEFFTINQAEALALETQQDDIQCYGIAQGAINISVSGGAGQYDFLWSNGADTEDLADLEAGLYTLTITDVNQCQLTESFEILAPSEMISSLTVQNVDCNGSSDGTIDLTISGGTTPYTYQWSNGSQTEDQANLTPDEYTVTISDANGCETTESVILSESSTIELEAITEQVSCNGANNGQIDLNVSGGSGSYIFAWSNGSQEEDLFNLSANDYLVTITDSNNCSTTALFTIEQPETLSLEAELDEIACYGIAQGAINISVSGGVGQYDFLWSNGSDTEDLTDLEAGIYSLTITDENQCQLTESFEILAPSEMTSSLTIQNIDCNGSNDGSINLTISGGVTPYTYQWSNGSDTEDQANLTPDEYSVTITDANGCESIESAILSESSAIELDALTEQVSCNGANNGLIDLNVSGGSGTYTFAWSNGSQEEDIFGLSPDNYSVTITDSNNCSTIDSYSITQPDTLTLAVSLEEVSCHGDAQGAIDISVSGGTGQYNYNWNNGGQNEDILNLTAGTYTLTLTDENACILIETFEITQPSEILIQETLTQPLCFDGIDGSIDLQVSGGTGNIAYQWNNGNQMQNLTDVPSGTYEVTLTDENWCTAIEAFELNAPEEIVANVFTDDGCGNNTASAAAYPTGGQAPYQYDWSTGEQTDELFFMAPGAYSLIITDAQGCTSAEAFTIGEVDPLAISSEVSHITCFGEYDGSINIDISGSIAPYDVFWSSGETVEDLNDLGPGEYSLTVFSSNGCGTNLTFQVQEPDPLEIDLDIITPVDGNDGQVTAYPSGGTTPYTISWSNGDNGVMADNLATGTYEVTVVDANACSIIEQFEISLTSDNNFLSSTSYEVFPNPTNGIFALQLKSTQVLEINISIFNAVGKQILAKTITGDSMVEYMDLEAFPDGVYFLELKTNIGRVVEKIVLTR